MVNVKAIRHQNEFISRLLQLVWTSICYLEWESQCNNNNTKCKQRHDSSGTVYYGKSDIHAET